MPLDPTTILWLSLIVLVSAFVQGMVGFAFGMIAMGFATLVLDAKTASYIVSPLAAINIVISLWSVRRAVRLPIVGPMVAGALLGMPLGVMILLGGSVLLIKLLVSVLLIYVGTARLIPRATERRSLPTWWGGIAGFGTGVIGGATNIGGPPIIAYAAHQSWSPEMFKAALLTTFLFNSTGKTIILVWKGVLDEAMLLMVAILAPVVIVGSLAGVRLFSRIDHALFGKIVAGMLLVLGFWVMLAP